MQNLILTENSELYQYLMKLYYEDLIDYRYIKLLKTCNIRKGSYLCECNTCIHYDNRIINTNYSIEDNKFIFNLYLFDHNYFFVIPYNGYNVYVYFNFDLKISSIQVLCIKDYDYNELQLKQVQNLFNSYLQQIRKEK